jgi:hypothetical protein
VKSRSVSEYRLSACRNTSQPWSVSAMTLRRRPCSEGLRATIPEHAEVANGHPHDGEGGLRPVLQREVGVLEEIAEHVVTRADLAD